MVDELKQLPKQLKEAPSLGAALLGGGTGIYMLITLLVNMQTEVTQHGVELNEVRSEAAACNAMVVGLAAKVSDMDARIVGRGPGGFHQTDWTRERKLLDAEFSAVELNYKHLSQQVDRWARQQDK